MKISDIQDLEMRILDQNSKVSISKGANTGNYNEEPTVVKRVTNIQNKFG